MNLLNKIQKERVAREYTTQVANQLLYIFNDYQDHDIYENIHAAVDYMVSYNEVFNVKAPSPAYVYHIKLSSVLDPENMIKLDCKRKVSKLTITLQDNAHMCNFNLFECYIKINSSNFDESMLDINIVHAAKDHPPVTYPLTTFEDVYDAINDVHVQAAKNDATNGIRVQAARKYPPFDKMYADSSILGELLVRFFTDVDNKTIKTEDYELELK